VGGKLIEGQQSQAQESGQSDLLHPQKPSPDTAQQAAQLVTARITEIQPVEENPIDRYANGGAEAFAAAAHLVHARWAQLTPDQRIGQLVDAANVQLAASGVPPIAWQFGNAGGATAVMNAPTWTMLCDPALFASPAISQAQMGWVVNTLYHEARHALQFFEVIRLVTDPSQLPAAIRSGPAFAQLWQTARKQPLADGSNESQLAGQWRDTINSPKNAKLEADMIAFTAAHKAEIDHYTRLMTDPNARPADKARAENQIKPILARMRAYAELPIEADAYDVGENAMSIYTSLEDPAPKP
jgi:hypothetical protein